MKVLRVLFYASLVFIGLAFATSFWFGRRWGRDVDTLSLTSSSGRPVRASRDKASGVWRFEVDDEASLAWAMGYAQALDREFQTEIVRRAATGRLAEWFGANVVGRDRLFRFAANAARAEAAAWSPETRAFATAFVAGRKAAVARAERLAPLEGRVFGLSEDGYGDWEPWELAAIARYHAWEFSADQTFELRSRVLQPLMDATTFASLFPGEPKSDGATLYRQAGVADSLVRPRAAGRDRLWPAFAVPEKLVAGGASTTTRMSSGVDAAFGWGGAETGASNLWIVSDPRTDRAVTLCNDTHLATNWPSSLIPIRYRLKDVDATGWMLPGAPGLVAGAVDRGDRRFAWGITIAAYADTQDFVALAPSDLNQSRATTESFVVRDPVSHEVTTKAVAEAWTPWGPRVDEFMGDAGRPFGGAVALDWVGFRKMASPLEFLRRRSLYGADGIERDLKDHWDFPSVNFTWAARDGAADADLGHVVTGAIYARAAGTREPGVLLNPRSAGARWLSRAADRPFFRRTEPRSEPFLLVSGNQEIFDDALSATLGREWHDRGRTQRLLNQVEELRRRPESGQLDFYSPTLAEFVKRARALVPADRLCSALETTSGEACLSALAALDQWRGYAMADEWEPTLAALWHAQSKWNLLPAAATKEPTEAARKWQRMNVADRALVHALAAGDDRAKELLTESFRQTIESLVKNIGPSPKTWLWGARHRMNWQHPARFLPAPLNDWVVGSFAGPPVELSGALDSPGRFDYAWSPEAPTEFPVTHAAAMRMCIEVPRTGATKVRWANSTGPSGNPMSRYSKTFADAYFRGVLVDVNQ